jgi:hypothetical protein
MKKPPEGGSTCTWDDHVHYGMMMMAAVDVRIVRQSIARAARRQGGEHPVPRKLWVNLCMNGG